MEIEDRSPKIDQLAKALSEAQAMIECAERTSKNAFLGNTYADLTSVMATVRGPLAGEGLAVTQTFMPMDGQTHLVTTLLHESGQFLRGFLPLLGVKDHHSLGSAITYARRFSLAAILAVCPADDDGETAMGRGKKSSGPSTITTGNQKEEEEEEANDAKAKCLIIIKQVRGAASYLRGKEIDPGNPPHNIRDKILELGPDGLAAKIKDAKKEEAKAIVDDAEKVDPAKDGEAA